MLRIELDLSAPGSFHESRRDPTRRFRRGIRRSDGEVKTKKKREVKKSRIMAFISKTGAILLSRDRCRA